MQLKISNTDEIFNKLYNDLKLIDNIDIELFDIGQMRILYKKENISKLIEISTKVHSEYFVISHEKKRIFILKRNYIDVLDKNKITKQVGITTYLKNEIQNILNS